MTTTRGRGTVFEVRNQYEENCTNSPTGDHPTRALAETDMAECIRPGLTFHIAEVDGEPCCDGTGWTGNPRERCTTHYETPGFGTAGLYA